MGKGASSFKYSEMCVVHQFCVVCFCAYVLSNVVSGGVERNEDDKSTPRGKENATKTSRGQNVKDVIHVHEHNGSQVSSESHGDSFQEGLFFAQKIFEKFGDDSHISKASLEKLFSELNIFTNESEKELEHDNHDHHDHAEHEKDTHEHDEDPHEHDKDLHEHDKDPHEHDKDPHEHGHQELNSHNHDQTADEHLDAGLKHEHHNDKNVHAEDNHEHEHLNESSKVEEQHPGGSSMNTDHSEHHHEHLREHKNDENKNNGSMLAHGPEHEHSDDEHHVSKRSETNDLLSNTRVKRKISTLNHSDIDHSRCLSAEEILKIYHFDVEASLTVEQFLHLSPAIIFQLDNPECRHAMSGHSHEKVKKTVGFSDISAKVWGYSTVAVIIISLVGLLGVAVIPIMQKVFYNHLLQFLVALAVGTLTGDALLHLLPHAIIGESHNHSIDHSTHDGPNAHHSAILKGLSALSGLFFFFLIERVMTIVTDIKRKRKQKKRHSLAPKQTTDCQDNKNRSIAMKLSAYDESDYQSCEEMVMVVHPNKSLKGFADETHHKVFHTTHDGCRPEEKNNSGSHSIPEADEEEGMLNSLPHSHSGHSHHAHCEMMTNSVASVAWMVILGDGIHNFSDGLAIGAAFSSSIPGGISTSVAVFCHELPHEIGDFAVLLRAGMSVKQAIVYNCLSSLLCFVGMLIGVAIGNIEAASQWIFACVAGMFIYIATVDMLPEMTSVDTKKGEHPFCHLCLQCLGMICGAGIMLIIAFYEDKLLSSLDYV